MSGKAGTVRFGVNPDIHTDDTTDNGISHVNTQIDGPWTEEHFAYNPVQRSREMGTTRGADPGQGYVRENHQADYMSNHDGYAGGDLHLVNLDERKVLHNTLYSIKCEHADDSPNGGAPAQTRGAFD